MKITLENIRSTITEMPSKPFDKRLIQAFTIKAPDAFFKAMWRPGWSGATSFISPKTHKVGTGLITKIKQWCLDNNIQLEITDNRNFPIITETANKDMLKGIELRDYQIDAINKAITEKTGLIQSATGAGKSAMIAGITQLLNKRTLLLVNRINLATQTSRMFIKLGIPRNNIKILYGSSDINALQAFIGHNPQAIVISTVQSAAKLLGPPNALQVFEVIISDECFAGTTKIITEDGIQTIKDLVKKKYTGKVACINPKTNKIEWKEVDGWYEKENKFKEIYNIYTSNSLYYPRICCTWNHKFRDLNNNEIMAQNLKEGNILRFYPKITKRNSWHQSLGKNQYQVALGTSLGDSSITGSRLAFNHGLKQTEYAKYKASILNASLSKEVRSGYTGKLIIGFKTKSLIDYELLRSKLYFSGKKYITKEILNEVKDIALAFWWMDDGSYQNNNGKLCTEGFTFEENKIISKWLNEQGIENKVVNSKKYFAIHINKKGMNILSNKIARYIHPTMQYKLHEKFRNKFITIISDNKDYSLIKIRGTKVINILTKSNKYSYNKVYNISVKDHHNYFANGFNVSNCHHTKARTWVKILKSCENAMFRYGLSGTIFSKDEEANYFRIAYIGDQIFEQKSADLVERKILSKPIIRIISIKPTDNSFYNTLRNIDDFARAYEMGIASNSHRNNIIVTIAKELQGKTLILFRLISHGQSLKKMLPQALYCDGNTPHDIRDKIIKGFNSRTRGILLASTVFDEGIDLPGIHNLVIASAGKSVIKVIQRLGRGMRMNDTGMVNVFDFYDKTNSHLEGHSLERIKIYKSESHLIKFID